MPQVIDVKSGSEDGEINLALVQNYIQQNMNLELCYYVVADNTLQDFTVILGTTGLPKVGDKLYSMYCVKVNPKSVGTVIHFLTGVRTTLWEVDTSFSTMMRDPSDTTPDVHWGGEVDKEYMPCDVITGAKVVNTAGEPLFTDKPVIFQTVSIHRRENYPFDPLTPARYVARVNSKQFYGFPVGTCLMMPIDVVEDTQDNEKVCWVTYTIKIYLRWNFDGSLMSNSWQAQLLNEGQMHRDFPGGIAKTNDDANGQIVKRNLDKDGLILQDQNLTGLISSGPFISSVVPSWKINHATEIPKVSDIGNKLVVTSGAGWNLGTYTIINVGIIGLITYWFVDAAPSSSFTTTGGVATIVRDPIYLFFNRFFYADFNTLTLGPF